MKGKISENIADVQTEQEATLKDLSNTTADATNTVPDDDDDDDLFACIKE